MTPPLIIAHRGASAEQPENTLAAFRRALARRADGIELDVLVTRDGVPVVFHDDQLRRLTGATGKLARRTWPELAELRVLGSEPIPRLVDVLRFTRRRVPVQIELKAGATLPPVLAAIAAARAERSVILASFSLPLVRAAHRLAPGIPRMLITEGRRPKAWLARQLRGVAAAGLSVNHRAISSAAWVRFFQQRGWRVWTWTVNDPGRAGQLAGWGVDALLGDDPALLRRSVCLL